MRGLQHLFIGRQTELGLEQLLADGLVLVEVAEQHRRVGVLEVVLRLLDLVLVVDIAIGDLAARAIGPDDVVDAVDALQVHREALEAVGDLARHRLAVDAAHLLEVGELRDFHAVEPHLPAETPGAERRRLPVVLDEADVVHQRVEAEHLERADVEIEDVERRGLHHHLELVVALQPEGVVAIAAVGGPAGRLYISRAPRLRPDRAQEGRGVEGACADLHVVGLQHDAAVVRPVFLEGEDQRLEGMHGTRDAAELAGGSAGIIAEGAFRFFFCANTLDLRVEARSWGCSSLDVRRLDLPQT